MYTAIYPTNGSVPPITSAVDLAPQPLTAALFVDFDNIYSALERRAAGKGDQYALVAQYFAAHPERWLLDLAELARVHVDMHDLCAWTELRGFARGPIVEPDAEADEEVALLEDEIGAARGVHADHAEEAWMVVRQGAETEERRRDRNRRLLGDPPQHVAGVRRDDARADQEHGPCGRVDERRGMRHVGGGG